MLFVLFRTKKKKSEPNTLSKRNQCSDVRYQNSIKIGQNNFIFFHSLSLSFLLFFIPFTIPLAILLCFFFHALRVPAFCFISFFSNVRWMDFVFRTMHTFILFPFTSGQFKVSFNVMCQHNIIINYKCIYCWLWYFLFDIYFSSAGHENPSWWSL